MLFVEGYPIRKCIIDNCKTTRHILSNKKMLGKELIYCKKHLIEKINKKNIMTKVEENNNTQLTDLESLKIKSEEDMKMFKRRNFVLMSIFTLSISVFLINAYIVIVLKKKKN